MGIRLRQLVGGLIIATLLVGCSQGHCRRKKDQPAAATPVSGPDTVVRTQENLGDRVLVYKYDGSLQCGQGKAINLDTMARELNGIQIFSSAKKPDGLMHIQVCGSITGMANVYEISAKDLRRAEGKGFKKWSFE